MPGVTSADPGLGAHVDGPGALRRLFDPRSVAVIGASTDPGKRGYQAVRALRESGYRYPVYPVNPRGGTLLGLEVLTGIEALPFGVDVALVALPGTAVPAALRELASVGVAGAVVLANGFRESGPDGAALECELAAVVARTGIRVVGPNTSGVLNTGTGANLVGVPDVPAGPVSLITQSGNMLLSFLADARALHGPGIHSYVGLGNQTDVGYHECLADLAGQPGTGAVAVHVEGFTDGRAFLAASARAARRRPIVLLRGGRSEAGRRSALSHTGSVAGSDAVARAVLGQAGVEVVERSDELAMLAGVLATSPAVPAGRAVAVLADGGGHATLAADALAAAGVPLAALSADTRDGLRTLLGPAASVANPIDVAGATDTDPTRFAAAAELLFSDPSVGLVLMIGLFGGYHLRFDPALGHAEASTAKELTEAAARRRLPLIVQSCYAVDQPTGHQILRDAGHPVLASIDHAVRAAAALHRRGHRLATADDRSDLTLPPTPPPAPPPAPERPARTGPLDEPSARRLVETAGLDTGRWFFARTPDEAEAAVRDIGQPCALKLVSPDVIHKSEAGGVRLGVTEHTLARDWAAITATVTERAPGAEISGMLVTPMAPSGVELLIGATRDPVFGPIVAFGSGGFLVEALRDVTFRAAPLRRLEALEMIDETTASRLLDGYRGLPPVDRRALADLLVRVGHLAATTPNLVELDLNPVLAAGSTLLPLDVRAVLD